MSMWNEDFPTFQGIHGVYEVEFVNGEKRMIDIQRYSLDTLAYLHTFEDETGRIYNGRLVLSAKKEE